MSDEYGSRPIRAVLDTNLLISAFILKRGAPHEIMTAWREGAFLVFTSTALREELEEVVRRPKYVRAYAATPEEIADFLAFVAARSQVVTPASGVPVAIRDPDDELLLTTALASDANYLVTGNRDLLALVGKPTLGALQVVTPRTFLDLMGRGVATP